MRKIILLAVCLLRLSISWATCLEHEITPPSQVRLEGDSVLIVVHASSTYDARHSTKRGLDEAVRFAKSNKIPVIYLEDDTPREFYFMGDCHPDYWVYSAGGEINFKVTAKHVYIAGGHLELCMSSALHDITYQWAKQPPQHREVTYLMDAIYSNGKKIEPSDPYYENFRRFLTIVTYGRPGGEHWPKVSLLETMGVINDQENELNYLEHILPRWDTTFSDAYQIEVQSNRSPKKILRGADSWFAPTIKFHFVDSAVLLSELQITPEIP